jgi:DtxR family Mn-dependent transcriptional regulator
MQTQTVEDYLKAIYELEQEGERLATTALAERLGVTPASVTGMLKKLARLKLVVHRPYRGVELTESGRKIALEVIRHHRLVELYLAEALGVPWDRVHDEAEKWEHVLSEDLEDRIDALLGHPTTDPHGAPIPTREGEFPKPESEYARLDELEPGQTAVIAEVSDHDPALLRYLGERGLYPNTKVHVTAKEPFGGSLTVRVAGRESALGPEAARYVFVMGVHSRSERALAKGRR